MHPGGPGDDSAGQEDIGGVRLAMPGYGEMGDRADAETGEAGMRSGGGEAGIALDDRGRYSDDGYDTNPDDVEAEEELEEKEEEEEEEEKEEEREENLTNGAEQIVSDYGRYSDDGTYSDDGYDASVDADDEGDEY